MHTHTSSELETPLVERPVGAQPTLPKLHISTVIAEKKETFSVRLLWAACCLG